MIVREVEHADEIVKFLAKFGIEYHGCALPGAVSAAWKHFWDRNDKPTAKPYDRRSMKRKATAVQIAIASCDVAKTTDRGLEIRAPGRLPDVFSSTATFD